MKYFEVEYMYTSGRWNVSDSARGLNCRFSFGLRCRNGPSYCIRLIIIGQNMAQSKITEEGKMALKRTGAYERLKNTQAVNTRGGLPK